MTNQARTPRTGFFRSAISAVNVREANSRTHVVPESQSKITRFVCCGDRNREASPQRSLHRHGLILIVTIRSRNDRRHHEQGFSASPDIPNLICQRKPLDRTLGLLRRGTLLRNKRSMNSIGFTPTSLHREEQATLMALSAKGQHSVFQRREVGKASGSYPRLMRPRFPNLLSPSGDISSIAFLPATIATDFRRMRYA